MTDKLNNGIDDKETVSRTPSPDFIPFFLIIVIFILGMICGLLIYPSEFMSVAIIKNDSCVFFHYEDENVIFSQVLNESQLLHKIHVMSLTNRTLVNATVFFREVSCGSGFYEDKRGLKK